MPSNEATLKLIAGIRAKHVEPQSSSTACPMKVEKRIEEFELEKIFNQIQKESPVVIDDHCHAVLNDSCCPKPPNMKSGDDLYMPVCKESAGVIYPPPYQPVDVTVDHNPRTREFYITDLKTGQKTTITESEFRLLPKYRNIVNVDVGSMLSKAANEYVSDHIARLKKAAQEYKDSVEDIKPIQPNEDGTFNIGQSVNIGSLICYLTGFHVGNCEHKEVYGITELYQRINKKLTPDYILRTVYGDISKLKIDIENFDNDDMWIKIKEKFGEKIKLRNVE
jgi:hypothetical protein